MPSEQLGEFLKPEVAAYGLEYTNGGLVGFAGGLPIKQNGEIVGYIGVSGGQFPRCCNRYCGQRNLRTKINPQNYGKQNNSDYRSRFWIR